MTFHLFIEPLDVWLFRDGKPFNAGSDHRAQSVFPPLPTVMQGVIRSHYIELNGGIPAYLAGDLPKVAARVGAKGEPPSETFRLGGPVLARYEDDVVTPYFPLPAHAYLAGETYHLLRPAIKEGVVTDLGPEQFLLWHTEESGPTKSEGGGWLSQGDLETLLRKRELTRSAVQPDDCFFERETRLGIELDAAARSTAAGKLYEAEFIRLRASTGLYLAGDGLDLPPNGVMLLGGEGHAGSYLKVAPPPGLPKIPVGDEGFTLTFLTPTYFEDGWQPANWQKFLGDSAKCVAAAVGKPLVLGGFDLAHKRHKPSRRYVPAGSTYFFKGTATLNPFYRIAICDSLADARIGFGQFILGGW